MELLAIIRRIDTDGDANVNYGEFAELLLPLAPVAVPVIAPVIAPTVVIPPPIRATSPLRSSSPVRVVQVSPRREVVVEERLVRSSSPARVVEVSPRRRVVVEERPVVPLAPPVYVSPSRLAPLTKPILPLYQEDELVHSLKEQCNLEQEIEAAKINLGNRTDFNIVDAFSVFDVPRYGQVDVHQLQAGLNAIGVYPTFDEC